VVTALLCRTRALPRRIYDTIHSIFVIPIFLDMYLKHPKYKKKKLQPKKKMATSTLHACASQQYLYVFPDLRRSPRMLRWGFYTFILSITFVRIGLTGTLGSHAL
jgi:hypothetical protein